MVVGEVILLCLDFTCPDDDDVEESVWRLGPLLPQQLQLQPQLQLDHCCHHNAQFQQVNYYRITEVSKNNFEQL